jgi:YD repeat-containing protein
LFAFNALAVTYEYDALNRLTKATYDDGSTIVYTYDSVGNRLTQDINGILTQLEIEVSTSNDYLLQNVPVYAFTAAGAYIGLSTLTNSQGLAYFYRQAFQPGQYKFRADYLGGQFWTPPLPMPGTSAYQLVIQEATATVTVEILGALQSGVTIHVCNADGTDLGLSQVTNSQGRVSFDLPVGLSFKFRVDIRNKSYWSNTTLITSGSPLEIPITIGANPLALVLSASPSGTGAASGGGNNYIWGSGVTATATSMSGYAFQNWTENGAIVSTNPVYSFILDDNRALVANFSWLNLPVRIAGPSPHYYATLQEAYNAALDGDIIQAQAVTFVGNLIINKNISITLEGGYLSDYSAYSGTMTQLKGMLQTLPGGGKITIKNIIITNQ